jgi:hypothetical protein
MDGRIYANELKNLPGQYLRPGTLLLTVGREREKELVLAVPQERIDFLRNSSGREIRFKVTGRKGEFSASLERIAPRATVEIPHFALATVAGGPLVVRQRSDRGGDRGSKQTMSTQQVLDQYELVRAHFVVRAGLGAVDGARLLEGERVKAKVFHGEKMSLANLVKEWISTYFLRVQDRLN